MNVMQIFSQVAITCEDAIATEKFYTQHFGFRRARVAELPDGAQIVFLKMADSAFYLELFQATEASPAPAATNDGPQYPGVRHLAFKVASVDAKLAELGEAAKITLGPLSFDDYIPGWRTAWISDPDGRIVELSEGFVDQENPPQLAA